MPGAYASPVVIAAAAKPRQTGERLGWVGFPSPHTSLFRSLNFLAGFTSGERNAKAIPCGSILELASHWIAARTEPNREAWARENIDRQGFQNYLPRFREWKFDKRQGRKRFFERFLFPGYIFVLTDGPWRFLTGTFGVLTVVCFGESPAVLQQSIVDHLREAEDKDGFVVLPKSEEEDHPRFQLGQRVRATEGLASGLIGIYQNSTTKHRARVLFNLLGRKTLVWVDEATLEPAKKKAA